MTRSSLKRLRQLVEELNDAAVCYGMDRDAVKNFIADEQEGADFAKLVSRFDTAVRERVFDCLSDADKKRSGWISAKELFRNIGVTAKRERPKRRRA